MPPSLGEGARDTPNIILFEADSRDTRCGVGDGTPTCARIAFKSDCRMHRGACICLASWTLYIVIVCRCTVSI